MNWKIATLGLGSVMVLLAAFSLSNTVMGFTGGTIHVSIPKAELEDVSMYGGSYEDPAVVVQEVGSLECPYGQTITRTMSLGPNSNLSLVATISMDYAEMSDVLMKAKSVASGTGTLENVEMWVEDAPEGLVQTVESGTMYDLVSDVYFVSMGLLSYENLGISIEVTG
jgi:hypothetical protein